MIPHKIQLKNFLSYGSQLQAIDFSGHALICLSGKNGHGKSALLDAITWALWGQGRKVLGTAKPDAGLLRMGQTQMLVIFDFEFNGTLYRIRREYMETYGKPVSILEFGLINPDTQEYIPLTDKTIRTTQAKIEKTLRLDFDSFSNSAFLRQGNSNEFSKKSPKDRKQILATILGLDQYELIRRKAFDKIKDAQTKKNVLLLLQEKRTQDLATEEHLTAELSTLRAATMQLIEQEQAWQAKRTQWEQLRAEIEKQITQHSLLTQHKEQLAGRYHQYHTNLTRMRTQWKEVHRKKKTIHSLSSLEHTKKQIIATITEQQKFFQANLEKKEFLLGLSQQIVTLEQSYKHEYAQKQQTLLLELERLTAEQKNRTNIYALLEDELKKYDLEDALLKKEITQLVTQNTENVALSTADIAHLEKKLEKRKGHYHHLVSQGNIISSELQNNAHKKNLVHEDDPSCPLCEQNLSASRRRFLKANFDKTESFLKHRLARLKRIIPLLKESLVQDHAAIQKHKETYEHVQKIITKISELQESQEKCNNARSTVIEKQLIIHQDIEKHANLIAQHTHKIQEHHIMVPNSDPHYLQLTQQKNDCEKELAEHSYNPTLYAQQQELLENIEKQMCDYEYLKKEIIEQDARAKEIGSFCIQLKEVKREIAQTDAQLATCGQATLKAQQLDSQGNTLTAEHTQLITSKDTLLQTKGRIEAQQKQLTKIKADFTQEQKNIANLDTIIEDYQTIAAATGKDGIQALLIEEAIPEIEQEANQLLSQLTNNQAHILIESLRDLKKGGTKETLDIKISDQNGIRPYEMFSGGEAFRIDFALRIAISKILARRAGTALQTLIIDEGFGSQDEDGLQHIMDALHTIQNNFSKIIVVSHLPAMKDQFPVQFVIQKGIQGSTVCVIEQG